MVKWSKTKFVFNKERKEYMRTKAVFSVQSNLKNVDIRRQLKILPIKSILFLKVVFLLCKIIQIGIVYTYKLLITSKECSRQEEQISSSD